MAESSVAVKVAVEAAVHQSLRKLAQHLWDEHRIRLDGAKIEWTDITTMGDDVRFEVLSVQASTTTCGC